MRVSKPKMLKLHNTRKIKTSGAGDVSENGNRYRSSYIDFDGGVEIHFSADDATKLADWLKKQYAPWAKQVEKDNAKRIGPEREA